MKNSRHLKMRYFLNGLVAAFPLICFAHSPTPNNPSSSSPSPAAASAHVSHPHLALPPAEENTRLQTSPTHPGAPVTLPAATSPARPASVPPTPQKGLSPENLQELRTLRFHGKQIQELKVLFVDDNKIIQKLAVRVLPAKLGIPAGNITSALNGDLAVAAVNQALADGKPYDLILMDENMPVKDGVTATAEIRHLENQVRQSSPNTVIRSVSIVANSNTEPLEQTRQRFMDAGATAYCFKDQLDEAYILRLFQAIKSVAAHLEAQERP